MLPLVSLTSVSKSFGAQAAVRDLSFEVRPGEIFGLLGPNGAGKTTTIRMILDLIRPDSGRIDVFGGPLDERKKDRLGYMPEEAGLYGDMRLADCLAYLGTLKGLSPREAHARVEAALERLHLAEHRRKKISKLSRGLYQKTQIVAAILHEPDLLIVDEPFANLDPVNAQLIREVLLDLRARGKSVIMSSHQMHLVQSLCNRIALIHQGRAVIYGPVREVQQQFARNEVVAAGEGEFASLPGVASAVRVDGTWRLKLQDGVSAPDLLRICAAQPGLRLERFEVALPSLDEIFIQAVAQSPGD